jgi:hypothetical protein
MAKPETLPDENGPDPFENFESVGAICAFLYKQCGADGVREALTMVDGFHREFLEDAAEELEQVGLGKVAAIVSEAAVKLPAKADEKCPFPLDSANGRDWQRRHEQARRRRSQRRSQK